MSYEENRVFNITDPITRYMPSLSDEIGINESILLLQLEFFIAISNNERDKQRWTYQSLSDIQAKLFPSISTSTINRTIHNLKNLGLITIAQYNKSKYDKTRWYALNLEGCEKLKSLSIREGSLLPTPPPTDLGQLTSSIIQIESPTVPTKSPIIQPESPIPESSPESKETNEAKIPVSCLIPLVTPTTSPTLPPVAEIKRRSSVSNQDLKSLLDLIPPEYETPKLGNRLEKAVTEGHSILYIAQSIYYTVDHAPRDFLAYLGNCIDKHYCPDGYVSKKIEIEAKEKAAVKTLEAGIQQEVETVKTQAAEKVEHDRKVSLIDSVEDPTEFDSFILNHKNISDFIKERYRKGKGQVLAQLNFIDAFFASLINSTPVITM